MGDDGYARSLLGHNGGLVDGLLIRGHFGAGTDLDDPCFDAGLADALGNFFDKKLGHHFCNIRAPYYPGLPVGGGTFLLCIKAGGADDINPGLPGQGFV